jgi:lipopolysaccharide transport system ATP-binding protein
MRFLRRFMETGTVLFVSHDTGTLTSLCDSAIWLDGGVKRLESSARAVSERYLEALVADRQGAAPPAAVATVGDERNVAATAEAPRATGGDAVRARPAFVGPGQSAPDDDRRRGIVDPRHALLAGTAHENRIEMFEFDPTSASFGVGNGRIVQTRLESSGGRDLNWVSGGEMVCLRVEAEAVQPLLRPIIGFLVRDRLGQQLFGDNTYLSTRDRASPLAAGDRIVARFEFQMPILPMGDYSITVALADGTQTDHVHHHWVHDALVFRSHSSSVSHGLVGIPMQSVTLESTRQHQFASSARDQPR